MAFPDAVALVVAYLDPLTAATVASRVPNPRPTQLVQVRRVGGLPLPPVRDVARLDVICWEITDAKAWTLAATIREAVWALAGTTLLGPVTYSVSEFMGPRQSDDSDTGTPRVWMTFELALRADDVIHRAP